VAWVDTMMGAGFASTHYVDITAHFAGKVAAIGAHRSQKPERFVEMMTQHNGFRATQANALPGSFAEAFRFDPVYPFVYIRAALPPPPPLRSVTDRHGMKD
jgi:hypothetical protein